MADTDGIITRLTDHKGLGLVELKTEGGVIKGYLVKARQPSRLARLKERLRWLPERMWWAFFGSDYYD